MFVLGVIANLVRQGLRIRYIWIGDGTLRRTFEKKARDLGVADQVLVTGWSQDISAYLQALDILAMPSKFEGLPLALLEAMGAGLCCCVSDVDGMTEDIHHPVGYTLTPSALVYLDMCISYLDIY